MLNFYSIAAWLFVFIHHWFIHYHQELTSVNFVNIFSLQAHNDCVYLSGDIISVGRHSNWEQHDDHNRDNHKHTL